MGSVIVFFFLSFVPLMDVVLSAFFFFVLVSQVPVAGTVVGLGRDMCVCRCGGRMDNVLVDVID